MENPRNRKAVYAAAWIIFVVVFLQLFEVNYMTQYRLSGRFDEDGYSLQSYDYTCAAAAMVTLLNENGIPAGEGEMATLAVTRPVWGASDIGMYRALRLKTRRFGLNVKILKANPVDLMQFRKPVMVSMSHNLQYDHAVNVLNVKMTRHATAVRIANPAFGVEILSGADFLRRYRGHAYVVYADSVYQTPGKGVRVERDRCELLWQQAHMIIDGDGGVSSIVREGHVN
jgi:hypothetical protein